jgi:hypothetical protein
VGHASCRKKTPYSLTPTLKGDTNWICNLHKSRALYFVLKTVDCGLHIWSPVFIRTPVSSRTMSASTPRKALNIDNINPHVRAAQYAVRGELAVRSEEYRAKLAKGEGKDLPFDTVIAANIGNPQQLDQKPITFFRQVASLLENPLLLDQEDVLIKHLGYKSDVIERAKWLLKEVKSVGAYSASQGAPGIRESVAKFIESMCDLLICYRLY